MNTLLWSLQIFLGVFFTAHGASLVVPSKSSREQFSALPFSSSFLAFIGVCEVLGGLGLLLPMWTGITPWLTPLAAAGLALIMAGAVWTHAVKKEGGKTGGTALITLLLACITFMRWSLF